MDANRFVSRRGPEAADPDRDVPAPDTGEPVFLAAPLPRPERRRHGLLAHWFVRGHGAGRRR